MLDKKSEIKYMMEKSFSLLVSDNRKDSESGNRKDSEPFNNILDFALSSSILSANQSPEIINKKLSILLNLHITLKVIIEKIVPEFRHPTTTEYLHENHEIPPELAEIDWDLTFNNWSNNLRKYVCIENQIISDVQSINTISLIILEITTHYEVFIKNLQSSFSVINSPIVKELVEECNKFTKRLYSFKEESLDKFTTYDTEFSKDEFITNFKNVLSSSSKYWGLSLFSHYRKEVSLIKLTNNSPITSKFIILRNQYLECRIWIYQEVSHRLKQRHNRNKLFEFFCFIEFIRALKLSNNSNVIQKSFLISSTNEELAKLDNKYYIFYDNRKNNFVKTRNILNKSITPAIKNIYVEWIIVNEVNYKKSIIIDTKHGKWNSREILKVIGYLSCYGINYGVIIFKNEIKKNEFNGPILGENIIRVDLSNNKHLYILSIKPNQKNEEANNETMALLIKNLIKKKVFTKEY